MTTPLSERIVCAVFKALDKLYVSMHPGASLSIAELDTLLPPPIPICRKRFSFIIANPDCPQREGDAP